MEAFSERVKMGEDGIYRWKGLIPKEDEKKEYLLTLKILGGICAFSIVFFVILSIQYHSYPSILIAVLSCAAIMGICGLIFYLLYRAPANAVQYYELYNDFLRTVSSKGGIWSYNNLKEIHIYDNYLELHKKHIRRKIYVHPEDADFIANFIVTHSPLGIKVEKHYMTGSEGGK